MFIKFFLQVEGTYMYSTVYMKSFKPRVPKWPPVNLPYGSHFSATEATYEVSQNMEKFVESLYIQEVDVSQSYFM